MSPYRISHGGRVGLSGAPTSMPGPGRSHASATCISDTQTYISDPEGQNLEAALGQKFGWTAEG